MKVDYTIPGWAPAAPRVGMAEPASAFEAKLRESAAALPASSREILGLKRPGPWELSIAPPPCPATLAYVDAGEERRMWHDLMHAHGGDATGLVALLAEMQDAEDAVAARAAKEGRG
jgi:hypothetical protein